MKDLRYPKTFPDKDEEFFLKMLLSDKDDFAELWRQWKERIVLDRLDRATSRMIPFLYLRLKESNIPDDEIKMIKGVYKHTWYKNLLVMDAAKKVISLFGKEGIPVILLKGVPLLVNVYKNTGARFIGDADLLIDPKYLEKAIQVMDANGWRRYFHESAFSDSPASELLANKYIKEITFINDQEVVIDIHWRMFLFSLKENKEHPMSYEEVLKHSGDFDLRGIRCRMPCNEDMIIHVIVHGARQGYQRMLRWVLDVEAIIRNCAVNWEFLIERIRKFDVAVELNVAFSYLLRTYPVSVPESFVKDLSELPMKKRRIREYYRTIESIDFFLSAKLFYLWRHYRLYERKGNLLTSWYYFVDYACKTRGIAKKRQIPSFIIERYRLRISYILNKL